MIFKSFVFLFFWMSLQVDPKAFIPRNLVYYNVLYW